MKALILLILISAFLLACGGGESLPIPSEQMVEERMNLQDFEGALELIIQRVERTSGIERDSARLIQAQLLQATNRNQDAFDVLDLILSSATDKEILHQATARYFIIARNEGNLPIAIENQKNRVSVSPNIANVAVMAQMYEYNQDKNNELKYRLLLQEMQESEENLAKIANIQAELGLIEDASNSLGILAQRVPDNFHVLLRKAEMELEGNRPDLAINTADNALQKNNFNDFQSFRFAHILKNAGALEKAIAAFNEIVVSGETQEVKDRALLEIIKIEIEKENRIEWVRESLLILSTSEIDYVREQSLELLTTLN